MENGRRALSKDIEQFLFCHWYTHSYTYSIRAHKQCTKTAHTNRELIHLWLITQSITSIEMRKTYLYVENNKNIILRILHYGKMVRKWYFMAYYCREGGVTVLYVDSGYRTLNFQICEAINVMVSEFFFLKVYQ